MDGVMKEAIAEPRPTVNEYAPKIDYMQIDPEKIGEVVGQRGKTINEIIKRTGVQIDIEDDGSVSICGNDAKGMEMAKKYITTIVSEFEEGQVLDGVVVSIKEFGAFVEYAPGKEGLVHISKIAKKRIDKVEDVLALGDTVKVKYMGLDKKGRMDFSIKDAEIEE
jgi:polyribonucleotide nucleotidyltransferase